MKRILLFLLFSSTKLIFSQNISVDSNTYSAQELVEDILINSGCIENVNVTNSVSGSFNNEKSFGYFQNNGGNFPYAEGIVMSTGRLSNVPGPNNSLSDDDAQNWGSDQDLENVLGVNNTLNATVIEFDFTPNANSIQFNYIFASEEYQEGDSNTCIYSDVFAFLIKPIGGTYTNIAVIPGTQTPVQVTTVHPEIPGGCEAENEEYFGSFNGSNSPINFNGQTASLTAQANVTPNSTYHIKLIIADEQNYRYDSAVFLEGGSFNIGADLGADKTGQNALCTGETYTLNVQSNGNTPQNYSWFKIENGTETPLTSGSSETEYVVSNPGTYKVLIDYGNGCTAEDTIKIEYVDFSSINNETLAECDANNDGISTFNLNLANSALTNNNQNFIISDFFVDQTDAENNTNRIQNPENFQNTTPNQIIFARIENQAGCYIIVSLTLETSSSVYDSVSLVECAETPTSLVSYNLQAASMAIETEIGSQVQGITFYTSIEDAISQQNSIENSQEISTENLPETVYARAGSNSCQGIVPVVLKSILSPQIDPTQTTQGFCENDEELIISAGTKNDAANYSYLWENGSTSSTLPVTEKGEYEVEITATKIIDGVTYNCSITNKITVVESGKAKIDHKLLGELGNFSVEILSKGIGNYVYSIDDLPFQRNNIFPVKAGTHTLYIKDLNGCGIVSKKISVVDYMRFFTPNNDGYNDTWKLIGANRENLEVEKIFIYDRFGKLIYQLSPYQSWNGTLNGKNLPANDYWFTVSFKNSSEFKGHFTLLR